MRSVRFVVALFLCLGFFVPYSRAQFSGSVQGTVADLSGASIPKASITLSNNATHVTQTITSDNGGVYRFSSLAPGSYSVSAKAPGFAPSRVDFRLEAAENRDVPIAMQVGNVSTSVEVTTQAALLDTSDSRLQYTLDQQALTDLPLSSRNPTANCSSTTNAKQYSTRVDKYFSKERLYVDFIRNTLTNNGPNPRTAFTTTNNYYGLAFQTNETHPVAPNLLTSASSPSTALKASSPFRSLVACSASLRVS